MKPVRNKHYLLNWVFLGCLLTLLLNDHLWKYQFSNWLTGKLSDAAGIIMLPLLLAFAIPGLRQHAIWISALLFAFWKSSFSQGVIDFYNRYAVIQTSRVVDLSDLSVLLLLPIPYFIIKRIDAVRVLRIPQVNPAWILLPSVLAFMATSPPPRYYYTRSDGNLKCYECYITVHKEQDEIVERLKKMDIAFDSISPIDPLDLERAPGLKDDNVHLYRLNELIIGKDTMRNLDFAMRTTKSGKTRIYFNGMQVSDDLRSIELENKLRKYYKEILFSELKRMLKS